MATKKPKARKKAAGVSDEAVKARTGNGWKQWFAILDKAGSKRKPHKEIAAWVAEHYDVGGWYAQMITVAYEQERGLREVHQKCDGEFQASGSKTIAAPLTTLYKAWSTKTSRKRWLADPDFTVRKATSNKSLRITWVDGRTHVDANFYSKGKAKSQISLQHSKLESAREAQRKKTYWKDNLARLKEVLED